MPNVLITGASRGIGLEFARQYAGEGWRVLATCREPGQADVLNAIAGDVAVHRLDVTRADEIDALARALGQQPIDLLINNAGIMPRACSELGRIDYNVLEEALAVNAIAPVRILEAFAGNLAAGRRKLAAVLSTRLSSLAEMGGGYLAYRASKTALNAAMKALVPDLQRRGIAVVLFHPGWVRTDMGGAGAPIDAATSVAGLRRVIAGLTLADSGRFLNYDGSEIPW